MMDYLLAIRRWVDAVEKVANTSPSVGLPADPNDPVGWVHATDAEHATEVVFAAAAHAWTTGGVL